MPAQAAQPIECRLIPFGARVALDQIKPLNRNVELCFVRIVRQHEFRTWSGDFARGRRLSWSKIERDESAKSRDAVIDMNDIIADLQIAKIRKESSRARPPLLLVFD